MARLFFSIVYWLTLFGQEVSRIEQSLRMQVKQFDCDSSPSIRTRQELEDELRVRVEHEEAKATLYKAKQSQDTTKCAAQGSPQTSRNPGDRLYRQV